MTRLTKWDRDVFALWADLGHIPEGHTERQAALAILQRALADLDEMHNIVEQIAKEAVAMSNQWTKRDAYQGQFTASDGGTFDGIRREP
jgi:hypothetical protein